METIKKWYKNIGEKIKTLAIVVFLVQAFAAVIGGISLMVAGIVSDEGGLVLFACGIACMLIGPFAAYIGSWMLYAFGDIATDCKRAADNSESETETIYYSNNDLPEL